VGDNSKPIRTKSGLTRELQERFYSLALRKFGHTDVTLMTDAQVEQLLTEAQRGLAQPVAADNFASIIGELQQDTESAESLALHDEAERIIGSRVYTEAQYVAAVEQAQREQSAPVEVDASEGFDLEKHLAVGDALDRIARDELGRNYDADTYLDVLRDAERTTGFTLDDYDRRNN